MFLITGVITNSTVSVINSSAVMIQWSSPSYAQSVPTGYNISINNNNIIVSGNLLTATVHYLSKYIHIILIN